MGACDGHKTLVSQSDCLLFAWKMHKLPGSQGYQTPNPITIYYSPCMVITMIVIAMSYFCLLFVLLISIYCMDRSLMP